MTDRDRLIEMIQNSVNGCARHWAEIIADYLLANGVLVPPCKVGDMVYEVGTDKEIYQSTITKIIYDTNGIAFDETAIGKTVFLTKEQAEEKLKELG